MKESEPSLLLIIPDLHHHTENADHWLTTQTYDLVIFLGDYFGDYEDNVSDARCTATWLRHRMGHERRHFSIGKPRRRVFVLQCAGTFLPGFTAAKSRGIY